jgi:hypothetical protein
MTTSQATTPERHPARFRSDRMEIVNIALDQETFDLLASLAGEEGSSVPALLREACRSFLDAKEAEPSAPLPDFPSTPPLTHYLSTGWKVFAAYSRRLAEVEKAADLEAGSLVNALLSGMPDNSPGELAGWIASGWICSQEEDELEAALAPVFKRRLNPA